MLTLTRSVGESIRIGDDIEVHVIEVRGGSVRLGFSAPREVAIHREEVYQQILEVRAVTSALTADVAAALAASLPGSAPAPAPAEAAPPPASAVPTATVRAPVPEGAGALGDRPASPSGDVVMPLSGTARPSPARMPKRAPGD